MINSGTRLVTSIYLPFTASIIIAATALGEGETYRWPELMTSQGASRELLVSVSVTDEKGRIAAKLSKEQFTVLDGKLSQQITSFEEVAAPYSVGFLFDTSQSMLHVDQERRALLRDNILQFIAQSHKASEYFFLTFAAHPQLLMEWTREASTAGQALNRLTFASPTGPTGLLDACYLGIEKLKARSNSRRALILVTDGQDTGSTHTHKEVSELLKQSDVVTYALFMTDVKYSSPANLGHASLIDLTATSGGAVFATDDQAKINGAFGSIAQEMRHQYLIGFNPAVFDGKWHSIKIKVKPIEVPDPSGPGKAPKQLKLFARTRQGFYLPKELPK